MLEIGPAQQRLFDLAAHLHHCRSERPSPASCTGRQRFRLRRLHVIQTRGLPGAGNRPPDRQLLGRRVSEHRDRWRGRARSPGATAILASDVRQRISRALTTQADALGLTGRFRLRGVPSRAAAAPDPVRKVDRSEWAYPMGTSRRAAPTGPAGFMQRRVSTTSREQPLRIRFSCGMPRSLRMGCRP